MTKRALEYQLQPDDYLCFIRLPKTGSTTLDSILSAKFHIKEVCPYLVADVPQAPPEQIAQYRLFRDHFDYDIRDYLPREPVYITMLRHPLDRAISFYEFCKRGQNFTPFDNFLRDATAAGLQEFICNPDPTLRVRNSNLQTRQIAAGLGIRHRDPFQASPVESQWSDEELLSLAKAHLKEFKFVGLTERFQDSMFLLSYVFGWYPLAKYQSLRVAPSKPRRSDLSQETIDAILSVNQLDLELYAYAQEIFEQDYAQMRQELIEKYGQPEHASQLAADAPPEQQQGVLLQLLEQHYDRRHQALNLPSVRSLDYTFLEALSGSGWQRRNGAFNGLQCGDNPFRWTGPSPESTLDLDLATDADLTIRFRIINSVAPDILESLTLSVNEHPVPLKTILDRGKTRIVQGVIPQAALVSDRSFTRLTLKVNRTISMQELRPNVPDKRIVGVAFDRIQIFPALAQPDDGEYLDLVFHADDQYWVEAAEFLKTQLKPTEELVAPDEFCERFATFSICPYSQSLVEQCHPQWVVIHKGLTQEISADLLRWTTQKLHPVFANSVFVIFSDRSDVQKLSDSDSHLLAFWETQPQSLYQKAWQKVKSKVPASLTQLFRDK